MNKIFEGVAGNNPALNRFDCSYTNTFSAKIGTLYVCGVDEVYPADVFKMSAFCHAEVQPMVAPLMSDLNIYAHTFFVPYRLIYGVDHEDGMPIWEKFITGGKDGDYTTPLPSWTPNWTATTFSSNKIWDSVGNPVAYAKVDDVPTWSPIVPDPDVLKVSCAPRNAYNFIFNTYYRDENLVDEVDLDNEDLLQVAFKKDYFTSALEQQQRGTTPALPVNITGTISVPVTGTMSGSGDVAGSLTDASIAPQYVNYSIEPMTYNQLIPNGVYVGNRSTSGGNGIEADTSSLIVTGSSTGSSNPQTLNASQIGSVVLSDGTKKYLDNVTSRSHSYYKLGVSQAVLTGGNVSGTANVSGTISGTGTADASSLTVTTFDIADLRLAFAIQRLQELSMRAGYRYTEYLSAHFGCSPTDARLDRPEYIGGCMVPINISPSVQTSGTNTSDETPQGNKIGIASADAIQEIGNYRVLEHGLIMTLLSIRPKPIYQQGINRQWLRQTRYDYYNPAFANLSEMGVYNAELYVDGTEDDADIFGYQAHWNELRCKNNFVSGAVREQFDYWTTARKFGSRPHLNADFITIQDSDFNKAFAVQDEDEFIISWSNIIDAYRPIPAMGVPGLVDHVYGGI